MWYKHRGAAVPGIIQLGVSLSHHLQKQGCGETWCDVNWVVCSAPGKRFVWFFVCRIDDIFLANCRSRVPIVEHQQRAFFCLYVDTMGLFYSWDVLRSDLWISSEMDSRGGGM